MDEWLGPRALDTDLGLGLAGIEVGVDHVPTLASADAQLLMQPR